MTKLCLDNERCLFHLVIVFLPLLDWSPNSLIASWNEPSVYCNEWKVAIKLSCLHHKVMNSLGGHRSLRPSASSNRESGPPSGMRRDQSYPSWTNVQLPPQTVDFQVNPPFHCSEAGYMDCGKPYYLHHTTIIKGQYNLSQRESR